jgi:hypothetical protein
LKRKLPYPDTPEARLFCQNWDKATHMGKLQLAKDWELSYQFAANYRAQCKVVDLPQPRHEYPDATWDEHIRIMKEMDTLIAIHQGIPAEITIEIETDMPIAITFTADWQLGQFGVDYDSFQRDISTIISTKNLYAYIGGDGYQNIIQPSKVGSSHNQTPICVQKALYVQTLQRMISHLLAVGTGNHNYWTALADGEDWDAELARRLKVVYTKHAGVINLVVGKQIYQILRLHKGRFNSSDNLTNTCKKHQKNDYPKARVIVVEHQHRAVIEQYRYNEVDCIAIRTGTYAVYDDYALSEGFFAAHVANPTVIFWPDRDKLIGFKDMGDAIVHLKVRNG